MLCPELDAETNASPSAAVSEARRCLRRERSRSSLRPRASALRRLLTVDGVVPSTLSIVAAGLSEAMSTVRNTEKSEQRCWGKMACFRNGQKNPGFFRWNPLFSGSCGALIEEVRRPR